MQWCPGLLPPGLDPSPATVAEEAPPPSPEEPPRGGRPVRFIELFAGIGGFRVGLEAVGTAEGSQGGAQEEGSQAEGTQTEGSQAGFVCVYASEKDRFARRSYEAGPHP